MIESYSPQLMNDGMGLGTKAGPEELREMANALVARHGEHAREYVRARIEACQTAGESADADAWQQMLNLLP